MANTFGPLVIYYNLAWLLEAGRQFYPVYGFAYFNQGTNQNLKSLQITQSSNEGGLKQRMELLEASGVNKEINTLGSSPPSCEHKCYGCSPCEAIQVPTITAHVGVQYTNYEPEGWMCKCGPTFYSP